MDEVLILAADEMDDGDFLVMAMIADDGNPEVKNFNRLDLTSLTEEEIEHNFRFKPDRFSAFCHGTSGFTGT